MELEAAGIAIRQDYEIKLQALKKEISVLELSRD